MNILPQVSPAYHKKSLLFQLTHEYQWKQIKLPAQKDALEYCDIPCFLGRSTESCYSMFFLFLSKIPSCSMLWEIWDKDPSCFPLDPQSPVCLLDLGLPNSATGMVITETIMKIHFQAGRPCLPANDFNRPAWIQPPAILPRWPKIQNIAARVPSSVFLYQEPKIKCAPTLYKTVRR